MTRRLLLAVALLVPAAPRAAAQGAPVQQPGEGRTVDNPDVKIDEHVGAQLPLGLVFRNERNEEVTLGQCVNGKPTILVLAYYRCPMNCTDVLNGLVEALRQFPPGFDAGNQFNVVVVSFDPKETPGLAAEKKKFYLAEYGRPGAETGWFFLTGRREPIRELTEAVGFGYSYDRVFKEYDHPSGVTVVTPSGTIARYFYGIKYDGNYRVPGGTTTLRLSLVEASEGKVGSLLDRIILRCYRFDFQSHKYTPNVMLAVRAAGVLTVLMLAAAVVFFKVRERRTAAARAGGSAKPEEGATC
ncbi:MAG: SCO family protein [Gemmataceae bacterium]